MSNGRNKLSNFSLLKSLIFDKNISYKTKHLQKINTSNDKKNKSRILGLMSSNYKNLLKSKKYINQSLNFCMPQYGQNYQKKNDLKISDIQNGHFFVKIDLQKELNKEEKRLFFWLCWRFPKCFHPVNKVPLKIGIIHDIFIIYQYEHNNMSTDQYILKKVIKRYVGDKRYQYCLLEHKKRFNLYGQVVQILSDYHISHAKKRLEEIDEKAHLRSQGIDIKAYYSQKHSQKQKKAKK